jgi:acyl-CoA thioesterase-2
MRDLSELLQSLDLESTGENRYRATNVGAGRDVIFGGQILGQSIVAAHRDQPDKEVKTIHTIFARGGQVSEPIEISVDPMHGGRTFGSVTVTVWQGSRLCARSLVLLHQPEPDLIRHEASPPEVDPPDATPVHEYEFNGYEIGIVGGVDVSDPDATGPAELPAWVRFKGAPDDLLISQALLAWSTDGFLIGTAMRPHKGVGQGQAHQDISTGVISHTLTFHEPFRADQWMLLAQESPYAGRGRSYGRAHVFTEDGRHIASFVQDAMIRHFPQGRSSEGRQGSVF